MSRFRNFVVGFGLFAVFAATVLLTVWIISTMFSGWALLGVCLLAVLLVIVAVILAFALLIMAHERRYPNDPDFMNFDIGYYQPFR